MLINKAIKIMNENANPLDYILKCAEQGLVPKLFTVQNAKDEFKRLREKAANSLDYKNIAWAKVNSYGDFYDLRLQLNPFETNTIPLYANKEELKKLLDSFR